MNAEQAIRAFTEKAVRRGLRFEQRSTGAVEVRGTEPDGFSVGLFAEGPVKIMVTAGGWHEHFDDMEESLNCATFLLSAACRLKTEFRGNSIIACTVQSRKDGQWEDDSTVTYLSFRYWRPKRIEYRQNTVIDRD